MDEIIDRLDAIERLLARLIAAVTDPDQISAELEHEIPVLQYSLSPEAARLLPHLERILDLARAARDASGS
jgi:hypothetical protein